MGGICALGQEGDGDTGRFLGGPDYRDEGGHDLSGAGEIGQQEARCLGLPLQGQHVGLFPEE